MRADADPRASAMRKADVTENFWLTSTASTLSCKNGGLELTPTLRLMTLLFGLPSVIAGVCLVVIGPATAVRPVPEL